MLSGSMNGSRVGVYAGYSKVGYDYERLLSANYPEELHQYIVGNLPSVLASRIAYFLNLKGLSGHSGYGMLLIACRGSYGM